MNDPNTRGLHLVIFDCDGVLVDSERIAVRVDTGILAELGWPLGESEIIERFVGRNKTSGPRNNRMRADQPTAGRRCGTLGASIWDPLPPGGCEGAAKSARWDEPSCGGG